MHAAAADHHQLALQVLKDAPDVILVLDLEGRIEHINPFFERLSGYRLDEVWGRLWFDAFLPERDRERIHALFVQSSGGEHVHGHVNPIVTRTGEERQIEWTDEFLRDQEGRATGIVAIGRDVTERLAAELQHRSVVAAMHDGVVVQSASGEIMSCNQAAERMLGLTADQMAGRTSLDPRWRCVHEDGTPFPGETHPAMVTLSTGAPATDVVMGVYRPEGDLVWISINSEPLLRPGDHAVVGAVTSFSDITERKRAEATLQATERRLAMVLDNVTDGFFTLDREWRYADINVVGARMVGHTPEELVGRAYLEVVPEAADTIWERTYRQVMNTGEAATVEAYYEPLDQWFEASVFPFADGISVFFRDISIRKRAERLLNDERERLRDAQRIAKLGSWELDLVTNSLVWSEEIFQIFEIDTSRFGASYEAFLEAIHPDDRAAVDTAYRESVASRALYEIVHRLLMPDGRLKWVQERGQTYYDAAGRPLRSVGTVQDITERKRNEERIRGHLREKETLLREIHHRVKNNLQVIAGLLHFQSKKLRAPEDVAAFAELRQRIFAMTLLHERLYQSPDVAHVIFCDYVRALIAELVRSSAPRQGIRIDVRTTNDVLLPIEMAMPGGMIVAELVINVLKHAFPGTRAGTATVSVRRVGDRIVLGVDDDGAGFPDGFIPGAGSSFGWELVRTLVLQLDGTVEATTDRGAHVRVSFAAPASAVGPHA
jgi:PAS domain S-box-containing protein